MFRSCEELELKAYETVDWCLISLYETLVSPEGLLAERGLRDILRTKQKLRTRRDILDAARNLLGQGQVPTVGSAAEHAGISRATAYRFFPRQDLLLLEALLGVVSVAMETALHDPSLPQTAEARLEALFRASFSGLASNEAAFRVYLKLSLEEPTFPLELKRAGRRLEYIDFALKPVLSQIPAKRLRPLRFALATLFGIEPLIVYRDICVISPEEAVEVSLQAALDLLHSAMRDSAQDAEKSALNGIANRQGTPKHSSSWRGSQPLGLRQRQCRGGDDFSCTRRHNLHRRCTDKRGPPPSGRGDIQPNRSWRRASAPSKRTMQQRVRGSSLLISIVFETVQITNEKRRYGKFS
ncbi:hypothetical protein U1Q18_052249 [Sarracenia purpurea var. burkii]